MAKLKLNNVEVITESGGTTKWKDTIAKIKADNPKN